MIPCIGAGDVVNGGVIAGERCAGVTASASAVAVSHLRNGARRGSFLPQGTEPDGRRGLRADRLDDPGAILRGGTVG